MVEPSFYVLGWKEVLSQLVQFMIKYIIAGSTAAGPNLQRRIVVQDAIMS